MLALKQFLHPKGEHLILKRLARSHVPRYSSEVQHCQVTQLPDAVQPSNQNTGNAEIVSKSVNHDVSMFMFSAADRGWQPRIPPRSQETLSEPGGLGSKRRARVG